MMKRFVLVIGLCWGILLPAGAQWIDTGEEDWDFKALTEMEWVMEVMGTMGSVPRVYVEETPMAEKEPPVELPEERIGGYKILKPEEGHEFYAILTEEIERETLFRRSDGLVFQNNTDLREGVFAIRRNKRNPDLYDRNVLKWPLVVKNYPEDSFYHYKDGVPESYGYHGKGLFLAAFDTPENTMEGVYMYNHKSRQGQENFRMVQLPNHDWRLTISLPSSQAQAYGHFFNCFIRRLRPGVWESDGAFGIQYKLFFEPKERRIRLEWEQREWKDFPLMNVYLYPYEDIFTPDGRVKMD